MSNYTKDGIISWVTLILVIVGIVLMFKLVPRLIRFLRAWGKRKSFLSRLKRTCAAAGYGLEVTANPYRSLFRMTEKPELRIDADGRTVWVKLITLMDPSSTYLFNGRNEVYRIKHWNPKYFTAVWTNPGFGWGKKRDMEKSGISRLILRSSLAADLGADFMQPMNAGDSSIEIPEDGELILCLNPISQEMRKVSGAETELLFDGSELDGAHVYSAGGLLKQIKEGGMVDHPADTLSPRRIAE